MLCPMFLDPDPMDSWHDLLDVHLFDKISLRYHSQSDLQPHVTEAAIKALTVGPMLQLVEGPWVIHRFKQLEVQKDMYI